MKFLLKMFIYFTIIVIISVFNDNMVVAKNPNTMVDLMDMDEPPEKVPEFSPAISRMRRNVNPQTTDEGDLPREEGFVRFRTRRDVPPGDSDIPQEFQDEPKGLRAKRQMPAPPGEMPMPPM